MPIPIMQLTNRIMVAMINNNTNGCGKGVGSMMDDRIVLSLLVDNTAGVLEHAI